MEPHEFATPTPPLPPAVYRQTLVELAHNAGSLASPLPKLRALREDVFFRAEYLYLHNLISLTGRNIHRACQLSGLSRSRLYTLLKKYQIVQTSTCPHRQK